MVAPGDSCGLPPLTGLVVTEQTHQRPGWGLGPFGQTAWAWAVGLAADQWGWSPGLSSPISTTDVTRTWAEVRGGSACLVSVQCLTEQALGKR